jgi:hypothetical protein
VICCGGRHTLSLQACKVNFARVNFSSFSEKLNVIFSSVLQKSSIAAQLLSDNIKTINYPQAKRINLGFSQEKLAVYDEKITFLGSADEIASSVLFLAGEGGSYITAQTLHVNGGMYTV